MPEIPLQLEVVVKSVTREAPGIRSYELRPMSGRALPPFTAGAHIDLNLPNGMVRSYSLVNPQDERHRYVIAVKKDRASRGGSLCLHEQVGEGDCLRVSAPRNNFPLAEEAARSIFIAGGIGITPILCMIRRLDSLGRSWELHYCTRERASAPFLEPIAAMQSEPRTRVHLNFDGEPGGRLLDMTDVVAAAPMDAHLYCCGPIPMLEAFEAATAGRAPGRVHVEYFAAKEAPVEGGGFTVVLKKSGRALFVPKGKTILGTVLDAGIDAPHLCMEGVCGTCETPVVEGTPDHRDLVLTKAEQASNLTMMICCSGCKGERLVLDL